MDIPVAEGLRYGRNGIVVWSKQSETPLWKRDACANSGKGSVWTWQKKQEWVGDLEPLQIISSNESNDGNPSKMKGVWKIKWI